MSVLDVVVGVIPLCQGTDFVLCSFHKLIYSHRLVFFIGWEITIALSLLPTFLKLVVEPHYPPL